MKEDLKEVLNSYDLKSEKTYSFVSNKINSYSSNGSFSEDTRSYFSEEADKFDYWGEYTTSKEKFENKLQKFIDYLDGSIKEYA